MKRKFIVAIILTAFIVPNIIANDKNKNDDYPNILSSPDEVTVVVHIKRIRSINLQNNTVYFKILINGEDSLWWQQSYRGMDISFEWPMAAKTVKYEKGKIIPIQIELWKKGIIDEPCDLSKGKSKYLGGKAVNIFYNLTTGEWYGDDWLKDGNGYGHCSGLEDGNYNENDYEIWFDIYEWDGDGDRLTYWDKMKYGLNVSKDYSNIDLDGDGIPCDWEDKYGYNPIEAEEHEKLDDDEDGLNNIEEWKTSQWLSDPFAKDIFVEVDFMKAKHVWQKDYRLPEKSQQMICDAFAKHNITLHIDDGSMGGGGDLLPFDDGMEGDELVAARFKYFLNGDPDYWRKGIFHYAIICCQIKWYYRPAGGRMFYLDSFVIGEQYVRNWLPVLRLQGTDYYTAMASVFMHELGHNLGLFNFEGIDNENTRFPWQEDYWKYGNYKSCMNYRYVFKLVDYSDGSHGENDYDDWGHLNLRRFDEEWWR